MTDSNKNEIPQLKENIMVRFKMKSRNLTATQVYTPTNRRIEEYYKIIQDLMAKE